MGRQQIPVVCYDKNHYIYPANLLVISRLAKLFMHRTIGDYIYTAGSAVPCSSLLSGCHRLSLKSCSYLPETRPRVYGPSSLF